MIEQLKSANSLQNIKQKAHAIKDDIIGYRRHIHTHPELSFKETGTASFVAEKLSSFGLKPKVVVGGTGVIAEVGEGGDVVVIRADMDALPIEELNSADYCSKNNGVMHACGHDAHTACALGVAKLLSVSPPRTGRVRFVFQPAEEATNDDGLSGASLIMAEGHLDGAKNVVALHVFPGIETGKIALRSGPMLAACGTFHITIKGKGAHGAWPHHGVDALVLASQVIQSIQTLVSRRTSALEPAVVTIGGIRSGTFAPNIIVESVELVGTVRYFHKETEVVIRREIENCCRVAEALGGAYELKYKAENPAVQNDPAVVETVRAVASQMFGEQSVEEADMQMGAEDFSFMSDKFPSCFICLGVGIEGEQKMLHTSTFDINEEALPLGTAILAGSALSLLGDLSKE
jgi:amidohydrolase